MPTIKSEKFTVKSYNIEITRRTPTPTRIIKLISDDLGHGIFFRITLLDFAKNTPIPNTVGQILNFGGLNFDPILLNAWIDPAVFNSFYAVLSGESPVTFNFEYAVDPAKPDNPTKDIWSVGLSAGDEVPGDFERPLVIHFPFLASKQPA